MRRKTEPQRPLQKNRGQPDPQEELISYLHQHGKGDGGLKELAGIFGFHPRTVSRWYNGHSQTPKWVPLALRGLTCAEK